MADYALKLVTPPALEPVSRAEAKLHLRVDIDDDDDLIDGLITAARQYCESVIGRSFITQTWRLSCDAWPGWEVRLPRGPVQSVTGVVYYDADGASQTLPTSDYEVDTDSDPARIQPSPDGDWPSVQAWKARAVRITYVAGHGDAASDVPAPVRQAIKLLVGHWYENREAVVTGTISTPLQLTVDALLTSVWNGEY